MIRFARRDATPKRPTSWSSTSAEKSTMSAFACRICSRAMAASETVAIRQATRSNCGDDSRTVAGVAARRRRQATITAAPIASP